jgi:Xaa-Pro aminopeptidase
MDKRVLAARRKKLGNQLLNNDLMIIFAASTPLYPRYFLQDNNFFYFTELEIPDSIFMVSKNNDKITCKLFIDRGIPEMVVWEGAKLSKEEAVRISGINNVHYLDQFDWHLSNALMGTKKCYMNIKVSSLNSQLKKQHKLSQEIGQSYPHISLNDIADLIRPLRSVKDKHEITRLQTAIDHTREGLISLMQQAEPGMMEYELEALLQYEVMRRGDMHMGFKSIVASGKNAATLHYADNNSKIGKNDLILLDIGGRHRNYSADISRTFPVAGRFSRRQEQVYKEVLKINKAIIEQVKPGVSLVTLNENTVQMIIESLFKLKLIKDKSEYRKYYMHSVSHHLGMDTHDLGSRTSVLEPGNVITIEPGIYISEEKIGIRIEDDILVTENGYKNLSEDVPKEIDDLLRVINK